MNKKLNKKQSQRINVPRNGQKLTPKKEENDDAAKDLFAIITYKMEDAWKEWNQNFQNLLNQQNNVQKKTKIQPKAEPEKKSKISKLEVKVQTSKSKLQKNQQPQTTNDKQTNQSKQNSTNFRKRTKSQNQTQLRSLKKTNQLINQKQQEEKKALRLKQITKRKIELMDRLKKIDMQLLQAKRQASPSLQKTGEKNFNQSNLNNLNNKSFIANLSASRMGKGTNQNVVQHHFKVVEMLQKINNEKIKRQQKIANQFRIKQQNQIIKIQQIQRKRAQQLEQRNRRNQLAVSKLIKNKNKVSKSKIINNVKLQEFKQLEQLPVNQSSVIPMTMIQKPKHKTPKQSDDQFLDKPIPSQNENMLTDRDNQQDQQKYAKQFNAAVIENNRDLQQLNQQNKVQSQQKISQQMINAQNQENKIQKELQQLPNADYNQMQVHQQPQIQS